MPQENLGVTEVAKNWEDLSDSAIRQGAYKDMIPIVENSVSAQLAAKTPEEYNTIFQQLQRESLEKAGGQFAVDNPEALAYGMNSGRPARDLRFDHMMDEIDNALHPSQGLPEYLQLKPKDLDKMSVAQVSEHVDKINAWRASQKAEVDAARAANAATVEHKAYDVVPGTDIPNDQGLRWVEIKAPKELPEKFAITQSDSGKFFAVDQENQSPLLLGRGQTLKQFNTPEEVVEAYYKNHPELIEDALKYEGEILQHCVGGYCPDVIEGRSRIFSLRDADGRPHATIETKPQQISTWDDVTAAVGQTEARRLWNEFQIRGDDDLSEFMRSKGINSTEKIAQIKGLQNKKPNDEYMPFIQDFVRGGQWSDVKDLDNAGLKSSKTMPERKRFQDAGIEVPNYFSPQDFDDMVKQYFEKTGSRYDPEFMQNQYGFPQRAKGGRVTKADLEQQFRMAFGGGVFNTDPDITDSGRIIPEHTI